MRIKRSGKEHASSVALIFILSLFTTSLYYIQGKLDYSLAFNFIPWGIIGAVIGAFLLKKVPNSLLRRIFGVLIIIGAVRILLS